MRKGLPMVAVRVIGIMRATPNLVASWRAEAAVLLRWGAALQANVLARCASDLEEMVGEVGRETLTLKEASRVSGYSADHLARLVREGTIPNAGRRNAPRIQRGDLPRKASLRSPPPALNFVGATPRQIARSVVTSDQGDVR